MCYVCLSGDVGGLQVLGTDDRKVLTLCHRAQVKRFMSDMLKLLKSQPGRQLSVGDLPAVFGNSDGPPSSCDTLLLFSEFGSARPSPFLMSVVDGTVALL